MKQIVLSEKAYESAVGIADSRNTTVHDLLEDLIAEEAANDAMQHSELQKLLAERSKSAAAGNTKPANEVLDRLARKYQASVD